VGWQQVHEQALPVGEVLVEHHGDRLAVRRAGHLFDPVIPDSGDRVDLGVGAVGVLPQVDKVVGADRRAV
jgi:hypothetical protein